ncbi:MAG: hypothetical protein IIX02_04560 [Clostridia bacterium]|nr:hypothetical protein [Clostridia bacterium]
MIKNEDNVGEDTTLTGAAVQTAGASAQEENASAVLGKFKDVNALARAYGALEAEFTRRSQRLKELEKLADNLPSNNAALGAEKLRKHAKARKEETKAFDEFVALVGTAHTDSVDLDGEPTANLVSAEENAELQTQTLGLENEAKEGGRYALKEKNTLADKPEGEGKTAELEAEPAREVDPFFDKESTDRGAERVKAFPAVAEHGNTEVSSEELYQRASRDEGVRLKIIGEYLASIGKNGAPLTANGAGVPITPPLKAKNIGDAGAMALQFFKLP